VEQVRRVTDALAVRPPDRRKLRGFLSKALFDAGLYCRADDRGDPVIQLAPPLTCGQEHFDEIEQKLRAVLEEAQTLL
jgi:adenosylmethionine-8-amino-7-oxononanoate aminotransferase